MPFSRAPRWTAATRSRRSRSYASSAAGTLARSTSAPELSPAPCRPRSTGWRPGRDAAASGARHRRAASSGHASRPAAARGRTAPIGMSFQPGSTGPDARIPSPKLAAQHVGVSGRRPGFLHFRIGRHEADIVDELARSHRKAEEMFSLAEPHLPAIGRPVRNALMRQHAAIGDRAVEDRPRRRRGIGPKLGVDAVRRDDDVAFGTAPLANDTRATSPVCSKPVPRCPVRTTPDGNAPRQHLDEIGAMHAERGVPARGVRHLDRGDRRAVVAKIMRTVADPGAASFDLMLQGRPAAIGARCSASGIPLPRPRRAQAPAHRRKHRSRGRSARSRRTARQFRLQ